MRRNYSSREYGTVIATGSRDLALGGYRAVDIGRGTVAVRDKNDEIVQAGRLERGLTVPWRAGVEHGPALQA